MKALRFLLAVLLTAPVVLLTATTAQAADLTVTPWTGYHNVFFSYPNQIEATGVPGSAVDLTAGTPQSQVQLATLRLALGQNPNCASGHVSNDKVVVALQYGSETLPFTFPITISWVCNRQAQLVIYLPPALDVDAGGGRRLTVTPHNYDPYAYLHPGSISVQWPENSTLVAPIEFDLALRTVDATPPTITPTITGTQGANGWYTSATDLTWTVTDAESAVSTTDCVDQHLTTDQAKKPYSCSATSAGGTAGPVTEEIGVDLTDPAVTCGTTPSFQLGQPGATVTGTVTDSGSGPVTTTVAALADTSSAGTRSVSLTGTDNAGRTTTLQCPYRVGYGWRGFFAPVDPGMNTAKAGRAVPLKWRVTDYAGAPVTTLTSASLTAVGLACALGGTADQVEEYAAGGSGLQNLGDGYYQLNWKTPTSYAGSCKTAQLDLGDGTPHTAAFAFVR